jgi:hypothetical protein
LAPYVMTSPCTLETMALLAIHTISPARGTTPTCHISVNLSFLKDFNGMHLIFIQCFERELLCYNLHHSTLQTSSLPERVRMRGKQLACRQLFPLLMKNQNKVYSVGSVNDYHVKPPYQNNTSNFMCIFVT